MSGFQRFVTYINLYEKNNKVRNVGFAKIDRQGEQCKMEIHMKGTGYSGISCPVYLFVRKQEKMEGISLGKIQMNNGIGDGKFLLNGTNINQSGYDMEQVDGFLIFATEHVMFASVWDDKDFTREQFVLAGEKKETMQEQTTVRREKREEDRKPAAVMAAEAVPQPVIEREEPWDTKWHFLLENYPVLTPFEGEEEILCIRLELKELRLLPKRYWYLGNNSFLLHGFFNYRYLILGSMLDDGKKRWFLGVPGVFQNQEKVMAAIFGFPEYKSEKTAEQKTDQFGYWYRFLE